jgi:hypothetical protein
MRIILISAISALTLVGCSASFDQKIAATATAVATGINTVATAVTSPAINQAANNLKAGAQATSCFFAVVSDIEDMLAKEVNAGQVVIKDSNTALTVTDTLCTFLGGTPQGSTTVPAN